MIELTAQIIIIILYLLVLYFVAGYDYYHMRVKLNEGLLLVVLGVAYMVATGLYMETLICLCLLLMIFGIPCLFGFGLGDLLVFVSLASFVAMGGIYWFLGVFFIVWVLWGVWMVKKKKDEGVFQRYRDAFSRKLMFTLEYPLVPVILIGFVIWLFLRCTPLF